MRLKCIYGLITIACIGCTQMPIKEKDSPTTDVKLHYKENMEKESESQTQFRPRDITKCKYEEELRTLEVESVSPAGCKLWYTRSGERRLVASSRLGTAHCERIRTSIHIKLSNAGYVCLNIQGLRLRNGKVKKFASARKEN